MQNFHVKVNKQLYGKQTDKQQKYGVQGISE